MRFGLNGNSSHITLNRRLYILLFVMVVPFIVFSTYRAVDITGRLEEEAQMESLMLAKGVARSVDDYIISTGEALVSIAGNENVRAQDYPKVNEFLKTIQPKYPFYHLIAFVDVKGNVKSVAMTSAFAKSEDAKKLAKTLNVSDTACYKRGVASDDLSVGDFMYSKITRMPVVHVTYPVYDFSGNKVGFIAAAFDLTRIQERLMESGIPDYVEIGAISDNGVVIARNREPEKFIGKDVSKEKVFTNMLGKTEGIDKVRSPDGAVRAFGFASASMVPWHVRAGVDTAHIQKKVRAELVHHFAIFIPLLLVALFGWYWIGRDVKRLHRKIAQLSLIDSLTKLWNYRKFHEDLEHEISRSKRYGKELSLLMIDIDHFKHYNDNNGHQAGDKALYDVSQVILKSIRAVDSVYRCGGEEICVILPETGRIVAALVAERIRAEIEGTYFPGEESQPLGKLSVSVGVATYPHDSISKEGLINCADVALYRAKEKGRNRVVPFSMEDLGSTAN